MSMELIDKAGAETDPSFFRTRLEDLAQCREEFAKLTELLDELCGPDQAPPSSNIRKELEACDEALRYVGRAALDVPQVAEGGEPGAAEASGDSVRRAPARPGAGVQDAAATGRLFSPHRAALAIVV